MGQRLVVTVRRNDEDIATLYYHWWAYTESALEVVKDLNRHVFSKMSKEDMEDNRKVQLALIRFAEHYSGDGYIPDEEREAHEEMRRNTLEALRKDNTEESFLLDFYRVNGICGGIDGGGKGSEWEYVKSIFPNETFSPDVNRNHGLVAISPEGMWKIQGWSEGDVFIDLTDDGPKVDFGNLYWLADEKMVKDIDEKDIYAFEKDIEYFDISDVDLIVKEVDKMKAHYRELLNDENFPLFMSGYSDEVFEFIC